jgi:hypothetical protein
VFTEPLPRNGSTRYNIEQFSTRRKHIAGVIFVEGCLHDLTLLRGILLHTVKYKAIKEIVNSLHLTGQLKGFVAKKRNGNLIIIIIITTTTIM